MNYEYNKNITSYSIFTACFFTGIFIGYKFKPSHLNYVKSLSYSMFKESTKLVLVVRSDLRMSKGKLISQCCHGTLMAYQNAQRMNPILCKEWELRGQAKVVVRAQNMEDILLLQQKAENLNVLNQLVKDAGRTEIAPGTCTVLSVGPDYISKVDKVTGHLKLLS